MDSTLIESEIRQALAIQTQLSSDEAVTAAAELLLQVLSPALRGATEKLAAQASDELNSQFGCEQVSVGMQDGDPVLRVTDNNTDTTLTSSDLDARITLRLPDALKEAIENAANTDGDSVNTLILKTLNNRSHRSRGTTMNTSVDL